MTGKNPNDVPLNTGMNEEEYAEAKVQRLDILIENERNSATKERYRELRSEWLTKVPKPKIVEKKKAKYAELTATEQQIGEKQAERKDRILRKAEALKKEKEVEELEKKRREILKEMELINSALEVRSDEGAGKDDTDGTDGTAGLRECPVCGEMLKNPDHPSHINSSAHQTALKLKEESEQAPTK